MEKFKILNLYACLGGNRYKWDEVADNIEVTAVELDPELAKLYQERFPNDTVIVADAHQYLIDYYKEFDFIWSSPPCPTHSRMRKTNTGEGERKSKASYPENVISFYEPLVVPKKRDRHFYWTNFNLPSDLKGRKANNFIHSKVSDLSEFHDYDFTKYKGKQRMDKVARNLVDFEAGKTILETVFGIERKKNEKQTSIFDNNNM